MSLSRKHFRAFASILSEQARPYMAHADYVALVRSVSRTLAEHGPNFNPATFRDACGLAAHE